MPNAPVAAAATGLPFTRRLFLGRASATAVALTVPAAAIAHAPDPIFAAIAKAVEANRIFEATLAKLSASEAAVLALGYGYAARVEFACASLASRDEIKDAFQVQRVRFPLQTAKIEAAEKRLLAEFDRRAAAIRAVEVQHDQDDLKRREGSESDAAIAAEIEALSTVPKTLAGMAALAEFMCLQRIADSDYAKLGAVSLATACRNLIPA